MVLNTHNLCYVPQQNDMHPTLAVPDISMNAGEWLVVWGGNGSGKSTLAAILAGWVPELLPGTLQGELLIAGQPVMQQVAQQAVSVQLVQQAPQWQLSGCAFTVEEEVAFGPANLGLPEADIHLRIDEALALTGCQSLRLRHPVSLSGGEMQRVVLASAIAMKPRLLLLDEAFSRLTPAATQQLLDNLHALSERDGLSIIFFERQGLPFADYCSQALLLQWNQPAQAGTPQSLFFPALSQIIVPDAWRVWGRLAEQGVCAAGIPPLNADALIRLLEGDHATRV